MIDIQEAAAIEPQHTEISASQTEPNSSPSTVMRSEDDDANGMIEQNSFNLLPLSDSDESDEEDFVEGSSVFVSDVDAAVDQNHESEALVEDVLMRILQGDLATIDVATGVDPSSLNNHIPSTISEDPSGAGNAELPTGLSLRKVSSSWCRISCSSHAYQLVRESLKRSGFGGLVGKVRQSVKFFRKSAVGADYLRKEFVRVHEFPLRPLVDVKTRWGSTMLMVKRYLQIEPHMTSATDKFVQDKVKFIGKGPAERPTSREKRSLESIVNILKDCEAATTLLRREKAPTMNIMDICTATIVGKLPIVEQAAEEGSKEKRLAGVLRQLVLARRRKISRERPMAFCCAQVASVLTPQYKNREHCVHLQL